MNISNAIAAPILLIIVLATIILFRSVFFKSDAVFAGEAGVVGAVSDEFDELDGIDGIDASVSPSNGESETDELGFIVYNGGRYYPDKFFTLAIISYICAYILPAVFYSKFKSLDRSYDLKLKLPPVRLTPFAVCMFFALISGTTLINALFYFISGDTITPAVDIDVGENVIFGLGVLAAFVIMPAVCEEFVFRSVLAAEYERYGLICAVLATSIAFSLSHFSLQSFAPYFFASLILFICVKITDSVIAAVLMHAGYNFFAIYAEGKLMNVLKLDQNRFIFAFVLIVVFIVSLSMALSSLEEFYYVKAYRNDPMPVSVPGNAARGVVNFASVFLSPTFIAAVIIFFIYVNFVGK